jgi:N-acetylmuramic acid 6-phosphate etherase
VVRPSRGEILIELPTGAEPVAGSTRLQAATATKIVLNLLTTGALSRLGWVYGARMVGVRPLSNKLRDRAERIVMDLAGVSRRRSRGLLGITRGDVRTAVVMARRRVPPAEARRLLRRAKGRLRSVIG